MRTLSPRTLREIRGHLAGAWDDQNSRSVNTCIGAIDRVLASNSSRGKRLVACKAPRKAVQRKKTKDVRFAVWARSGGRCEACGTQYIYEDGTDRDHLDHFWGGNGRRRAMERVESCWRLCKFCDQRKTNNDPDAAAWLARFRGHCLTHGYVAEAKIAAARLQALEIKRMSR